MFLPFFAAAVAATPALPLTDAPAAAEAPLGVLGPAAKGDLALLDPAEVHRLKYQHHIRLANAGLITLGIGAGLTVIGGVDAVGGAVLGDSGAATTGLIVLVLGSSGSWIGQAIFTVAGLEAAYDLDNLGRKGPVEAGWLGCGMMLGGATLSIVGVGTASLSDADVAEVPVAATIGSLLTIGSLVPGAITYALDLEHGVDLRLSVAPTLVPVRLADGSVQTVPAFGVAATW